jgi:phospholipid transport system substrate-binding protein
VRSEVVVPRGEPIQLDYRLEKAGDSWRIYDVNVLGVWLVETYRNQFAQEVAARGIDGLIRSLADKNRSFETPRKS